MGGNCRMDMLKRCLALMISLLLCFGFVTTSSSAEDPEMTGPAEPVEEEFEVFEEVYEGETETYEDEGVSDPYENPEENLVDENSVTEADIPADENLTAEADESAVEQTLEADAEEQEAMENSVDSEEVIPEQETTVNEESAEIDAKAALNDEETAGEDTAEEKAVETETEESDDTEEDDASEAETEGSEVLLTEEFLWEEDLVIESECVARVTGVVVIPEGFTVTVYGTLLLEEEAMLTVEGNLLFGESATVEGDIFAIVAGETGIIEGLERFLQETEETEDEEASALTWEDILETGVFNADEAVLITENVIIPADAVLIMCSGELTIAPEASLAVEGLLQIDGGTLTVSEGAFLKNEQSILIEGHGALIVEGGYEQTEQARLIWDDTGEITMIIEELPDFAEDEELPSEPVPEPEESDVQTESAEPTPEETDAAALVVGIDRKLIDRIIDTADAVILNDFLSPEGFRTVTITGDTLVTDEEFLSILSGELIVAPGARLAVDGLLVLDGGTLTIEEGATLTNNLFILVKAQGVLTVAGSYEQAEAAVLTWDSTSGESLVEGVGRGLIEKIVYAADASALNALLSSDGFRMVTIMVSSADLVNAAGSIPDGVVICQS